MNPAFQQSNYVIKRKGISTSKFRICSPKGDLLLYAEEKIQWKSPFTTTIQFFTDEGKTQEILLARDGKHVEYPSFLEVSDPSDGGKVGGVGGDWTNWFEDAWAVVGADGQTACTLREPSAGRAILSQLTDGLVSQKINFLAGDQVIGELRQKAALVGHQLLVDLSKDTAGKLDRRLALVAAIVVAAHQALDQAD